MEEITLLGLTDEEVHERSEDGRVNKDPETTSRSTWQIVYANVFNPVNAIMLALFVLILIAGFPADGLFVGVVIGNSFIGVSQEMYARSELQKLQLLNSPNVRVFRNAEEVNIEAQAIVQDDLVIVGAGDQIVVDGEVLRTSGLEIDESLLTGESDPISKAIGDEVLSGSFVNAGSGIFQAKRVGSESYANSLALEAKRFSLVDSELRKGINKILRYVTPRFFIKNTLKEVYYDKTKLTDKKIDTYRDLILRENNRESFINRTNSSPVDYTQRLKSIVIPAQIIWGNEDEWISVDNAKLFSEALPNNRVDIMKETGHLPMEERPYESLELFLNFINEN